MSTNKEVRVPRTNLGWDYFYDRIKGISEISAALKNEALSGLSFLEKELGVGFFNTCGKNHPVYHKLIMAGGEDQLKEFVKWIHVLRTLKQTSGSYSRLLQKLHSKAEALVEAIPFIDISDRCMNQGFHVEFPEERQGQKNPDMELTYLDTNEKVFVEISRVSEGAERAQQDKLYHRLVDLCFSYGFWLPVAGKLYKMIPDDDLPGIEKKMLELMEEASQKEVLATYRYRYLSIAFAHPDRLNELDDWCNRLKIARRFDGFDIRFDYTTRLLKTSRIDKEAKQLPKDRPGLICFPMHILYMQTMDIAATVVSFGDQLARYRNLIGIVCYGEVMTPLNKSITIENDQFIYAVRENEAHAVRYTLFVKNPGFDLLVSPELMNAINHAVV